MSCSQLIPPGFASVPTSVVQSLRLEPFDALLLTSARGSVCGGGGGGGDDDGDEGRGSSAAVVAAIVEVLPQLPPDESPQEGGAPPGDKVSGDGPEHASPPPSRLGLHPKLEEFLVVYSEMARRNADGEADAEGEAGAATGAEAYESRSTRASDRITAVADDDGAPPRRMQNQQRRSVPVTIRCVVPTIDDDDTGPIETMDTVEIMSATYHARRVVSVREVRDDDSDSDDGGSSSPRCLALRLRLVHSDEPSLEQALRIGRPGAAVVGETHSSSSPSDAMIGIDAGGAGCDDPTMVDYNGPYRRAVRSIRRSLAGTIVSEGVVVPVSIPPSWSTSLDGGGGGSWDPAFGTYPLGGGGGGDDVAYFLVESVEERGGLDCDDNLDDNEVEGSSSFSSDDVEDQEDINRGDNDDDDLAIADRPCYRLGPPASFSVYVVPPQEQPADDVDGDAESFDGGGSGNGLAAFASTALGGRGVAPDVMDDDDDTGTTSLSCPGYESLADEIVRLAHVDEAAGAPSAVLLTGCPGVGKTRMASFIAARMVNASSESHPSATVRYVSAKDVLLAASTTPSLRDLASLIIQPSHPSEPARFASSASGRKAATTSRRAVLIIDDLDAIVDAEGGEETIVATQDPERVLALNAVAAAIDRMVAQAQQPITGADAGRSRSNDSSGGCAYPAPFILGLCCASASRLPSDLVRVGRFEKVVNMSAPTEHQREAIFASLLRSLPIAAPHSNPKSSGVGECDDNPALSARRRTEETVARWAAALASRSAGCVASDVRRICADALTRAHSRVSFPSRSETSKGDVWEFYAAPEAEATVEWDDVREAARVCVPSQLARLDVTTATVLDSDDDVITDGRIDYRTLHERSWRQFGGYGEMKDRLYRTVVDPWKHRSIRVTAERALHPPADVGQSASSNLVAAATLEISPPSGILFHGPPGTGKTMAAQCLASSLGLPVVKIHLSDILDQWLGGSEAAIRSLFERARAAAPCILFFDEIDSLATNRQNDDGSTDVHSRVLSTLLNEMDGVSSRSGREGVLVVAATNRLGAIDAALLRPGRLEEHVEIPKPTLRDIEEILRLHMARMPVGSDVECNDLAIRLEEYGACGADIEGICTGACMHAIRHFSDEAGIGDIALSSADFDEAIRQWKL